MLRTRRSQAGITLVELMVAGAIGLIALSALLTVYSATAIHNTQLLQQAHLHQQLRSLMFLISTDLKRAGYRAFFPGLLAASDNPFQNPINQVRTHAYGEESRNSCILFAYDLDQDGLVGIGRCGATGCDNLTDDDNVEQFGYRLRNAWIQSRFGGTGFNCDSGYWQTVNDPDIEITQLHFEQHSRCVNLVEVGSTCTPAAAQLTRSGIQIRIKGQLRNRVDTAILLTHWVRMRNDLFKAGDNDAD